MNLFDVYPLYNIEPTKANDVWVFDANGTKYLDLYGGHAVISIGHSNPHYIQKIQQQVAVLGFYSNAVKNPLQQKLANLLGELSGCQEYQLFLCNSGAEANENALKTASFVTEKSGIIAFKNAFHGRTSAAVAATDNTKINALLNQQHQVTFVELGDLKAVENTLQKQNTCAVIIECIQGVGGLDESTTTFYQELAALCKQYNTLLIADEIQSGYGRTGQFFAFQKHNIQPDIITLAKGMGNGFPIGGVLFNSFIQPHYGMLGTTFGGNHLACAAGIAVLEVLKQEKLMQQVQQASNYFIQQAQQISEVKQIKGRGLMLGLEFEFEVAQLRKELIFTHKIFTGGASNKKLLRILPPLTLQKTHIDLFINALKKALNS